MRRAAAWFALAGLVMAADQVVKWLVLTSLEHGERIAVAPFFNLVLVFNKGAAFSFLAQEAGWQRPLLIAFAVVASAVVSVMIVRSPARKVLCTGLALILGGAVGNVIDRLVLGHVVDYLDLHAFGWHWPAFNIADSAITIGAALVILDGFLRDETPNAAGGSAPGRVGK